MIEVFDSFETKFICNPTILVCPNDPIRRTRVIAILIFQMILACHNDKWRYRPTTRIDILDYSDLFSIVRLYGFNFLTSIVRRYNKGGCNLAYEKVCFVEVLDIGFYDIMFNNYILEKSKPSFNDLWIFVLDLLIIVQTVSIYIEFWLLFDEVGNLMQSDTRCIVYR